MGSTGKNINTGRESFKNDVKAFLNNPNVAARWGAGYAQEVREAAAESRSKLSGNTRATLSEEGSRSVIANAKSAERRIKRNERAARTYPRRGRR